MSDIFDFSRMMESISLPVDDDQPLAHFQHGVSVVMTITDNGMPFIRSLPGLIPQKFLREIIVVDLGASDELLDCIEKVSQEFPVLRLISNKRHLSKYQALNLGAKRAFGKYLMFVDQDAILPKDATIKMLVGFANRGDNPSIVSAKVVGKNYHPSHQLLDPKQATMAALGLKPSGLYKEVAEQYATHVGKIEPGCFMISRTNFWAFDGFDASLGDMAVQELCLKMHMNCGGVYLAHLCQVMMGPQFTSKPQPYKETVRFYKKHFNMGQNRRWISILTQVMRLKGLWASVKGVLGKLKRQPKPAKQTDQTIQDLLKREPMA